MGDDPTKKLPGEQDADRIDTLIGAVQSMSARLEALEKTFNERMYDTKPIWERALAEIAETRAELKAEIAETRAKLKAEIAETRTELKAEIAETRTELKAEIAETRAELRSEMRDGFRTLGSKMDVLNQDVLTVPAEQRLLGKRVQDLESKVS